MMQSQTAVDEYELRSFCECGRLKGTDDECCSRCEYLDTGGVGGRRWRHHSGAIIDALRGSDGMSLREIVHAIGGYSSILSGQRSVLRTMQMLVERKRVRRYWRDGDSVEITRRHFGREVATFASGRDGCWVYILDGVTEDGR